MVPVGWSGMAHVQWEICRCAGVHARTSCGTCGFGASPIASRVGRVSAQQRRMRAIAQAHDEDATLAIDLLIVHMEDEGWIGVHRTELECHLDAVHLPLG